MSYLVCINKGHTLYCQALSHPTQVQKSKDGEMFEVFLHGCKLLPSHYSGFQNIAMAHKHSV